MMLWASLSVHLHLTAVAVPLALLAYALLQGRDARWPDAVVALGAASLPFAGGLPLFVDAVGRGGLGPALVAQTAAVPALAVGLLLVRPRTMTAGWPARGLGALLGLWAVGWLAAGRPPLRLFDLIIAFDGGVAAAAGGAPPWGATLWRLLATRAMVPWDAAIVGVPGLVGVGALAWRRDAASRAVAAWLAASAAVTLAVMAAAGPEPRYAWLFAQPWAIALGLGTVVVWRSAHGAADRAGPGGRVGLALAALAPGWAVPSYKAPAVWIAAVPGAGAAWRAPWAGRVAGLALGIGLWSVTTARWAEGNTPGLLHVDLDAFRAQAALPGVGEDGVLGCVHRLGPPVAPLPGSWLLFASMAPPARDVDTCRAAWVVDAPTPFENTPGAVPVGPDDRVAFPEFARVRPGQGAMTAVLDDGIRSWAIAGRPLPFRSAAYRPVPPFTARIGLFPWVLRDRDGGPAAQAEVVVDAHGAWAHTLAVRVASHPVGDPPPRCAVTAWGPAAPLARVPGGDPHAGGLWEFQLTPALHRVPLTVAVAGCPVESLDVFPVSGVRTSSVDVPVR